MKVKFLFPGKTREGFLAEGSAFYFKRLKPLAEATEVIVKGADLKHEPSPGERAAALDREAEALLAKVGSREALVALDVAGRLLTSEELAAFLEKVRDRGQAAAFALGGPWGLGPALLRRADLSLSLSPMTFTHELARLILLEQVYRAFSILAGAPYHK